MTINCKISCNDDSVLLIKLVLLSAIKLYCLKATLKLLKDIKIAITVVMADSIIVRSYSCLIMLPYKILQYTNSISSVTLNMLNCVSISTFYSNKNRHVPKCSLYLCSRNDHYILFTCYKKIIDQTSLFLSLLHLLCWKQKLE